MPPAISTRAASGEGYILFVPSSDVAAVPQAGRTVGPIELCISFPGGAGTEHWGERSSGSSRCGGLGELKKYIYQGKSRSGRRGRDEGRLGLLFVPRKSWLSEGKYHLPVRGKD